MLMTSELEADLENHRCSLKLSKKGMGMKGGLPSVLPVLITIAAGRWSGAGGGEGAVHTR